MNGRKAKELREAAYGDFSHRNNKYTRSLDGSIRNEGRRAVYQKSKKNSHPQSEPNKFTQKAKRRPRWLFPGKKGQ